MLLQIKVVPRIIRPYVRDEFFFEEDFMEELVLFLLTFIFIFLLYQLFVIRRAKRKKKKKHPIEVSYLMYRYHLDLEKVDYNRLLQIVALVSSFDIAVIVSVIMNFSNFFLEIAVGFILTLIVILLSYHIVYLFYKKKGMIKNES